MASEAFKSQIEEVTLYKFGLDAISYGTEKNSVNIVAQVIELSLFESIFSPVIRGELVLQDAIGLFTNFPLTGEEIVEIIYKTHDNETRKELMVIESVDDITISDDNRTATYIIKIVSIEAWANARRNVQRGYNAVSASVVAQIYTEFIDEPLEKLLPSTYRVRPLTVRAVDEVDKMWIIPNIKPFAAIDMVSRYAEPLSKKEFSFMFYQNRHGYFYQTLQEMFEISRTTAARQRAFDNGYKYISDEIEGSNTMDNENRIVTNLNFNKRHSTLQKIGLGYYQNKLFEINMAQKAYFVTERTANDVVGIEKNKLNTQEYIQLHTPILDSEEAANRVKYFINNQRENNQSFPVSQKRERWGRDLIERIALSQVDITITIPGDPTLSVGELFYLEVADAHGFNENKEDDLISGYFLITEKRDTLTQDGNFTTSLRIQKDSYVTSVDRNSRLRYEQGLIV